MDHGLSTCLWTEDFGLSTIIKYTQYYIYMEHILKYFPKAEKWSQVTEKYLNKILTEYEVPKEKILYAACICPDELNYSVTNFNGHFEKAFCLGGLAGIPYTGKTGMAAYASHIPADGASFIYFGPHVGISSDGSIGHVIREHQHDHTFTCGSLISVLDRMRRDHVFDWSVNNFEDLQARVIEKLLHNHKERIFKAETDVLEALKILYNVSECLLRQFITENKTVFPSPHIFLLGGVVINTDAGEENYAEMWSFDHLDLRYL